MNLELRQEMLRDIRNAYFDAIRRNKDNPSASVLDIIADAHRSPAPRFYISARKAQEYTSLILNGRPLRVTNPTRVAMYNEISARYQSLCPPQKRDKTKKSISVFAEIVQQPAPSFYLTFESFRSLLYESLNTRLP